MHVYTYMQLHVLYTCTYMYVHVCPRVNQERTLYMHSHFLSRIHCIIYIQCIMYIIYTVYTVYNTCTHVIQHWCEGTCGSGVKGKQSCRANSLH